MAGFPWPKDPPSPKLNRLPHPDDSEIMAETSQCFFCRGELRTRSLKRCGRCRAALYCVSTHLFVFTQPLNAPAEHRLPEE